MNVLLLISPSAQNDTKALTENRASKAPVGQGVSKEGQSSRLPLPFSQILEGQIQVTPLLAHGQRVSSTHMQEDLTSPVFLAQKNPSHVAGLDMSDAADQRPHESQVLGGQTPSENIRLTSPDLEILAEPDRFHLARFRDVSFNGPNTVILEETHAPLNVSSAVGPSLEGQPLTANGVLDPRGLQGNAEQVTLGLVRQESSGEPTPSGTSKIPLSKVLETGLHPQPVSQGAGEKPSVVSVNREGEALARPFLPTGKDISNGSELIGRSVSQNETMRPSILPQSSSILPAEPSPVLPQRTLPVTANHAEGPVGFTESAPVSSAAIKPILGNSSVLKDALGAVNEHRPTVPVDRHGESGLFGKVEHAQHVLETSTKTVGLDSTGGQGLGGGMNHSPNSQQGFQQPLSLSGQGLGQGGGMRGLEERVPELPAPALQRLQMDVQLSDNQRVQIDVGVHNRQVYTGLVMDHSVLRNLAAQFVPQLENQLAEVDMELQEFSAEVREEREDHADTLFHDRQSHESHEASGPSHGERRSALNALHRPEERGLHLVA